MKNSEVLKRILRYSAPYRATLVIMILSAVISVAAALYVPVIIGNAINFIVDTGRVDFGALLPLLVTLLITAAAAALFQWIMNYSTNLLSNNTVRDMRADIFSKLQRLPLSEIDGSVHGDVMSRVINDIDRISDGLLQGFTQIFSGVATIAGTIIFMLAINVPIAVTVIVLTPLSLFVAAFIAKRVSKWFKEQAAVNGELSGYVEESLNAQTVIKSFGFEKKAQAEFEEIDGRLYSSGAKAQFYSSLTNPCTRFVNSVVYAAVLIVGAVSVLRFGLTVGMLSTFLSYANQYTKPFNEITGVITELQSAFASARRVFEVIDKKDEISDKNSSALLTDCRGEVTIKNVDFSYSSDKRLIESFSLSAAQGQRIAIVGPTGCGKTTVINLLMRFYDVDSGSITIDGIDVRELSRDNLRRNFGMVLQDTWLFKGTVRENIAYGRDEATDGEIIAAAKLAHAHSFIKRLENGYDTLIAEGGDNISQGQKQLLCIARIMLSAPPMLILDEATSSIDTRTEIKIQKAFDAMMEGRTSFIVAHRLSTIREADCIVVMRDGKIVEQGRHDELLSKNGFYAELYNSQFAVQNQKGLI